MDIQINITESAQEYLAGLLAKQTTEGMSVRMFVTQPARLRRAFRSSASRALLSATCVFCSCAVCDVESVPLLCVFAMAVT